MGEQLQLTGSIPQIPLRSLREYRSEPIRGLQYQSKIALQIATDAIGNLYYSVKSPDSLREYTRYVPLGPQTELKRTHLDELVATLVRTLFIEDVPVSLARDMNCGLYQKLEQDLLLR